MKVSQLLSTKGRQVTTIDESRPVLEAVNELRDRGIGALVVSGERAPLVGILSERDIVRALASSGAQALDLPVRSIMSSQVVTCNESETLDRLMKLMTDRRIRHVPVVEDGVLTGMISIGDVVKHRVEQLENDKRDLLEYVSAR
ncbi:MAG: CBS domain-containing protein [Acidobacteria bacterium]|nr:CBS domain-containing protein [Acidobacteriota bacterium]